MTISAIREKLYDYIRIADDKKIKAIYMMLEDEITEDIQWRNDNPFVRELDRRHTDWKSGKEEAFTTQQIDASVEELRQQRKAK